jgi:hypothetical protein
VVQCQIEEMKQRNFKLKTAKTNFIVYWQKENTKQEVKIVLPELYFGEQMVTVTNELRFTGPPGLVNCLPTSPPSAIIIRHITCQSRLRGI